jgi:hypothetical protein
MIRIKDIVQTCIACPSQWDMWDEDGKYYYVRYRWSTLRVDKADSEEDWMSLKKQTIFSMVRDENHGGYMEYDELREILEANGFILP